MFQPESRKQREEVGQPTTPDQAKASTPNAPIPFEPPPPIGFALEAPAESAHLSGRELAAYRKLSQEFAAARAASLGDLLSLMRSAFDISDRLEGAGKWNSRGAIPALELKEGWAKQACQTLARLHKESKELYIEDSETVLRTVLADFTKRLQAYGGTATLRAYSPSIVQILEAQGVSETGRLAYGERLQEMVRRYGVPLVYFKDHESDPVFFVDQNDHIGSKGWWCAAGCRSKTKDNRGTAGEVGTSGYDRCSASSAV
ncbi:MAG: hypothetical protein EBZ48_01715 [Proteobacteria bacterium]|nr:hypothetical protein [Pseudomonadota bacterium]